MEQQIHWNFKLVLSVFLRGRGSPVAAECEILNQCVGTQFDNRNSDFVDHARSFVSNCQRSDRTHGCGDREV